MSLKDFRAVCLPYCIKKQSNGKYLVLNREYKPLSFKTMSNDFHDQDLPIYLNIKGLTPELMEKIFKIGTGAGILNEGNDLYLYDDGTNPWFPEFRDDYFKRLDLLMGLRID